MNRNPKCPVCHRNLIYKDEIETVWVCRRDAIYYEILEGGKDNDQRRSDKMVKNI
jgi:ribosomal protein L37AE/L43A